MIPDRRPLACLPMYDLPELQAVTDAWWAGLARHLSDAGVADVPATLTRGGDPLALLADPGLLLGQTCGYPLVHALNGRVAYLGTPRYEAAGCDKGDYRSFVVLRVDDQAASVAELKGRRAAINGWDSQSGMNALRALVAPHAENGRFFSEVLVSGAHRRSLELVKQGAADVAAIDCVTLALLGRADPAALEGLEPRFETAAAPALPYVTRHDIEPGLLAVLRSALEAALRDPSLAEVRAALLIRGMDFDRAADYAVIAEMERAAAVLGYPELA